ncbi:MAG: carboxypeptidase-like regulatory domain-containing protein [Cyclobacteriaceae bacterium]
MTKIPLLLLMACIFTLKANAQELTQTIRGTVVDEVSEITLPGATVLLLNTEPSLGAVTDLDGEFRIENVPLGRYTAFISYVGYEPITIGDIVVHSGKSNVVNIKLKESLTSLEEVVVTGESPKDLPLNDMAVVSARVFTVEETERYAGGLDDPARMATAFAGVTSASIGQNAIVVRGNAPKGVQWRMEGIEIPSPSHFAGATTTGGGFVTLLSNHVLDNSDFLTGAFPAEYGNAMSGVFDMNLREGNNEEHEHTFKAGMLGVDFASEGPLSKSKTSSYLFNYRYSTLGLIQPILPEEANTIRYQDLSFKLSFHTKAGEFALWGIGGNDFGENNNKLITDPSEWELEDDFTDQEYGFNVGATGISHKLNLSDNTLLKTSIVASANDAFWDVDRLNDQGMLLPETKVKTLTGTYSVSAVINQKLTKGVSNRSGVLFHRHFYDLSIQEAIDHGQPLRTLVKENGATYRWQAFTQTSYRFSPLFSTNIGFHSQYFTQNEQLTLEPRASWKWNITAFKSISFGYGNHSQLEGAKIYQIQDAFGSLPNRDLKLGRAHHLVLSYDWLISDDVRLKVEPYYQYLYDVPVIADSTFSMLNFEQDWFFDQPLENTGKGKNYGLDITLEKFFSNNFYYLISGSVFQAKYRGGDGTWRDSRFNRNYAFNILGGKEWQAGVSGNKWWSINLGLNLMGGKRRSPLNHSASIMAQEEVLDENRAYESREPATNYMDMTISFRKNKSKYSSIWSLQIKNLLGSPDFDGYLYNYKQQTMVKQESAIVIPNLSYKIEF